VNDGGEASRSERPTARIAHGAVRGAIAAMAMTGMRAFTKDGGIVEQAPPEAILRKRAAGLVRRVPHRRREWLIELVHWGYGAGGGAAFAALPERVRLRPWGGAVFGTALWLGFEVAIAPALGLEQARRLRLVERAALFADHVLYGLILSELRRRPRE
jgi:hypothetical protein